MDTVESILMELVALSRAKDNTARWRCCQLIHAMIAGLPADAALSDDVADAIQDAMLERLEDSRPNIKAAAARALARLPDPGDAGDFSECPITTALLDILSSDKSKEVRKSVLASLPASMHTLPNFMERTLDEADEVRKIMYLAIAEKLPLGAMTTEERALLLKRGITDRSPMVSEAARSMLETWLDTACEGEPLTLLRAIDVQLHPEEGELALKALLHCGRLDAVKFGQLAAAESVGLRADFSLATDHLMSAEGAVFWRVICEWLSTDAASKGLSAANSVGAVANIDAAAAGDRLEALESALPATVQELATMCAVHAHAGPTHRFVASQLMQLMAQCADFGDALGRKAAAQVVMEQLSVVSENWNESWKTAMGMLIRKVYVTPGELSEAILGSLQTIFTLAGFMDGKATAIEWTHALNIVCILLEQLPTARPALACVSEFPFADMHATFILPGISHDCESVRAEAFRALGLYCLLESIPTSMAEHVTTLRMRFSTTSETPGVRAVAAQGLCDLALQRGPKALDMLHVATTVHDGSLDPCVPSELHSAPLVDVLLYVLQDWREGLSAISIEATASLGTAISEGLARLCLVNEYKRDAEERRGCAPTTLEESEVLRVLIALLLAAFDTATEKATKMRQSLAVFFEKLASMSLIGQQYLATCLLPAARCALIEEVSAGGKVSISNSVTVQLMRFVLQLLQLPVVRTQDGELEPHGHEPLAELLLGEALTVLGVGGIKNGSVSKAYFTALCRLPLGLPTFDSGPEIRATAARCAVIASAVRARVSDKTLAKDLVSIEDKYWEAAGAMESRPEMSPEEVAALLESVKSHVEAFTSGYPLAGCDDGDTESSGTRRSDRVTRAQGVMAESSSSSSEDSSSDGDSGEDEVVMPRPRSTRATRVMKALKDENVSDDEEENNDWEDSNRRSSLSKTRRASIASVDALKEALKENMQIKD